MAAGTIFRKKVTINADGKLIDLSTPKVMGIINLTPDSFYAGSRKPVIADALQQAGKMLEEGAQLLDIGAYSSRPGAEDISVQEETDRLLPVVEIISANYPEAIISVDTFRSQVATAAVNAGAHIINDISGGQLDADMFATAAKLQVPYILMHMKGNPQTMQSLAEYEDVFNEVLDYFVEKYHQLTALGVKDVILDPGFGFAKKAVHSYALMNRLQDFAILGLPILAGLSRKKMIQRVLDVTAEEALNGTTALNTIALTKGANILRVHDVEAAVQAIKIFQAVNN